MNLIRQLLLALTFFTRLRLPFQFNTQGVTLASAAWAFPLIGSLIGGVSSIFLLLALALDFPPDIAAWVAVIAGLVLTGAIHEDGLADSADALAFGRSAEEKLVIMKDSRIGTFGVLALIASVGMKVAIIAAIPVTYVVGVLIASAMLSRLMMAMMMFISPYAKTDGLAASAGRPSEYVMVAAISLTVVAIIYMLNICCFALMAALSLLVMVWIRMLAIRYLGGITGDVLGALQQCSEITCLMVALVALS